MEPYTDFGMVMPKWWRICIGTLDFVQEGILFPPSLEDCYKSGHIEQCTHKINKRECGPCCGRCTQCGLSRKEMKPFDYLPIGPWLTLILKSKSFYHEILEMWRNRIMWMNRNVDDFIDPIMDFWNGSKVRITQNF